MTKQSLHEQLKKQALVDPSVRAEYEALEEEFALLKELVKARLEAHKTQSDVAASMGTSASVVGRLETGGGKRRHSPTLATLKRYAHAVGCELKVVLVPRKSGSR